MHPIEFKLITAFLKRVMSTLFGIVCTLTGLLSTLVAVVLMFTHDNRLRPSSNTLMLRFLVLLYCEIFIAFSIAAILVGLRHVFNRNDWFVSRVNRHWRKAMKYAMLLPAVSIGLGIVLRLIDLLV